MCLKLYPFTTDRKAKMSEDGGCMVMRGRNGEDGEGNHSVLPPFPSHGQVFKAVVGF